MYFVEFYTFLINRLHVEPQFYLKKKQSLSFLVVTKFVAN